MNEKIFSTDLEDVFEKVRSQVVWLHGRWIIYRQLFGTSEMRIELLNAGSSTFFFFIQETLMDDIQLTLSKLADPAQTGSNKNLSLETLYDVVGSLGEDELHTELEKSLGKFRDKCKKFKERRDKKLAHFDYKMLMNQSSKPLPGISRQMVEDALQELRHFMNLIEGHFKNTQMAYHHFLMTDDGETLITRLKRGLRYEELIRARKISHDDFENSQYYQA